MGESTSGSDSRKGVSVSFVVPAYNVSQYVSRCLESIQALRTPEIEIVVINDGSVDNTSEICRDLARDDARIRVHDQQNRGLSEARNVGVKLSRGRYVSFVDADDYISAKLFQAALFDAERVDADVVVSGAIVVNAAGEVLEKRIPLAVSNDSVYGGEYLKAALGAGTLRMCAPYNIYAGTLLKEVAPPFLSGIYHEDELWTPQVLLAADRVITSDQPFYFHSVRTTGSIMSSSNAIARSTDLLRVVRELDPIVDALSDPELRAAIDENRVSLFLSAVYSGRLRGTREDWSMPVLPFLKRARSLRNRSRAMLYVLSPRLYWTANQIYKGMLSSRWAKGSKVEL